MHICYYAYILKKKIEKKTTQLYCSKAKNDSV